MVEFDRIEEEDGGLVIVDFNSGKKLSMMTKVAIPLDIQLNVYAIALRHFGGELPKRTSLVDLNEEGGSQIDYFPIEESMKVFEDKLSELIQGFMYERFSPSSGFMMCKF